jgi:hypothetical protein
MRVVFIGNFDVPFSTESHHAWTWERLGHEVIKLQENRTCLWEIISACNQADLLSWTHTHGWHILCEEQIPSIHIPSFSYHLDRYFGIQNRESDYLSHPSFHLNYFFSTDGGNDDGWKRAGINHRYLPAGVVEYGCFLDNRPVDIPVLFTGSVGYHHEYAFRPAMVAALQANYGERFQVRTNVREKALNELYASARVCVGDHIFAGAPLYTSDRLFETVGRGGFLIYPDTPGVTDLIPGLVTYRPQDIQDLIAKIDYYLDPAHEQERLWRRDLAFNWVRQHGTYTNRLQEVLRVMNLD